MYTLLFVGSHSDVSIKASSYCPYCTCGDIEDTHHFLFVCHQYTDLRRDLLNSVSDICQPNLNVLLCGDITLIFVQNKQIFKAVQEFIIKSKRYEYKH